MVEFCHRDFFHGYWGYYGDKGEIVTMVQHLTWKYFPLSFGVFALHPGLGLWSGRGSGAPSTPRIARFNSVCSWHLLPIPMHFSFALRLNPCLTFFFLYAQFCILFFIYEINYSFACLGILLLKNCNHLSPLVLAGVPT